MLQRPVRKIVIIMIMGCFLVPSQCDMCDRRDKRMYRDKNSWKGDVGDLESFPGGMVKNKFQIPHSRVRRFLSFPTGSMLSFTPKLTIPWVSEWNGDVTGDQIYKFPIDLVLPNSTLRFTKFNDDSDHQHGYGMGGMGGMGKNDYYHHNDINQGGWMQESEEEMSSYAEGYDQLYANRNPQHYWGRKRRSLIDQRIKGFEFLQRILENFGLDGRECLLRAVCEIAEEPIEDLGMTGDILNLFFSAGYGGPAEELAEFLLAEVSGRTSEDDCEVLYQGCPYNLVMMAHSALSYFHGGLAHVGNINSDSLAA